MRKSWGVLLMLVLTGLGIGSAATDRHSLLEADKAFSKMSETRGIRDAFLAFLADDGIVFRPRPVAGKKLYAERPERPGLLAWTPAIADISLSSELGYTSGPYEFRQKKDDTAPVACGHYVTAWMRQPDGTWKAVLDAGVEHPCGPAADFDALEPDGSPEDSAMPRATPDPKKEEQTLLDMDLNLSFPSSATGASKPLIDSLSEDVRVYRFGSFPVKGKKAAEALLSKTAGGLVYKPMAARVSQSADLGYTYGTAESGTKTGGGPGGESCFLRIWKKGRKGKWEIVLDLLNPILPPKK